MPYRCENMKGQTYYLHGKAVTLRHDRKQQIFSFAREPKAGEALDALPAGREIVESPRTGLPFLKGTSAAASGTPPPEHDGPRRRRATRRGAPVAAPIVDVGGGPSSAAGRGRGRAKAASPRAAEPARAARPTGVEARIEGAAL